MHYSSLLESTTIRVIGGKITVGELEPWFCDNTEQLHFRIIRDSSSNKQGRLKCKKGSEAGRVSFQSDLTQCASFTVPFTLQWVGWFLTEQDAREEIQKGGLREKMAKLIKVTARRCAVLYYSQSLCLVSLIYRTVL